MMHFFLVCSQGNRNAKRYWPSFFVWALRILQGRRICNYAFNFCRSFRTRKSYGLILQYRVWLLHARLWHASLVLRLKMDFNSKNSLFSVGILHAFVISSCQGHVFDLVSILLSDLPWTALQRSNFLELHLSLFKWKLTWHLFLGWRTSKKSEISNMGGLQRKPF